MELQTEFAEALIEAHRKVRRDPKTMDALLERREDDGIGDAGFRVRLAEVPDNGGEVEYLVEGRLSLRATDFHAGQ